MNSRTLIVITGLLIFSIVVNLYLLGTKANNQKNANLSTTFSNTPNSENLSLPISQSHQGVTSAFLVYIFSGKVTQLTTTEDNIRIKLDISGSDLPDFVTTPRTQIVKYADTNSTIQPPAMSIKNVTPGSDVTVSMIYHLDTKTWETSGIIIQKEAPSQSSATSSAK